MATLDICYLVRGYLFLLVSEYRIASVAYPVLPSFHFEFWLLFSFLYGGGGGGGEVEPFRL